VGFSIDKDQYWLQTDESRIGPARSRTWVVWLITAAALSLVGAAFIARLINSPLKQLSFAASRMRDGDFDASLLDEKAATSEIREVNIGFNRMAEQLSKVEQDRVIMLAGISHDLRTPLARLRLETEMSVADEDARAHMAADISQLDAIIDKFLDYARAEPAKLASVSLNAVMQAAVYAVGEADDMRITVALPDHLNVLADETELLRVMSNLIENARRYGKTPETGIARVDIAAKTRDQWVLIKVRDHGMGVAPDALPKLTRPFFRGDAARTAATGAGLGLAIVEKTIQRMGGMFGLANTESGGLVAHIKLRRS
jgi:two-component system osmolarity sensor histidine kinase EnvZ